MAQMMEKKMVLIGSDVLPIGMRLAGVRESYSVQSADEAERLLARLLDRKDVGIIVISEGLAKEVKDRFVRYRMENSIDPVVIFVPGYRDKVEGEDMLRKLILRAVGVDIMSARGSQA